MKRKRLPPHGKRRPRLKPIKRPTSTYGQVWRIIDAAVRATFDAHPDYLSSPRRAYAVRMSINKRAVGDIIGWAAQRAARGRSHSDGRPT